MLLCLIDFSKKIFIFQMPSTKPKKILYFSEAINLWGKRGSIIRPTLIASLWSMSVPIYRVAASHIWAWTMGTMLALCKFAAKWKSLDLLNMLLVGPSLRRDKQTQFIPAQSLCPRQSYEHCRFWVRPTNFHRKQLLPSWIFCGQLGKIFE